MLFSFNRSPIFFAELRAEPEPWSEDRAIVSGAFFGGSTVYTCGGAHAKGRLHRILQGLRSGGLLCRDHP